MRSSQLNIHGFIDHGYQGEVAGKNAYQCIKPLPPLNQWLHCFWQLNVPLTPIHT